MKKEQTVKKNNNKKTPRNKKHFFPEMQTLTAAQFFFFFFIRHKEGDGGFWNWEESSFDNTWHAGFLRLPTCSCPPPPICFAQPSGNEEW